MCSFIRLGNISSIVETGLQHIFPHFPHFSIPITTFPKQLPQITL